jgi:acyl-coenzyme A synthetase/AMP-(fatty) acid ligase
VQVLETLRVADVVRGHAQSRPDVVAIRCGPRALTYAELDDRSNRLAQALLGAGVTAGDRVAHLDRTAPEIVELLFAASKIGAVTVPLNWRLATAELEKIVADAGCNVMIAGPAYREAAREIARTTAVHPCAGSGTCTLGNSAETLATINTQKKLVPGITSIVFHCEDTTGATVPGDGSGGCAAPDVVRVEVHAKFAPAALLGLFGQIDIASSSSNQMQ